MSDKKIIIYYWLGTILQISIVCFILALLKYYSVEYGNLIGMLLMAIGGLSSAIWGSIISVKSGRVKSFWYIVTDFFRLKQSPFYYFLIIVFIMINFGLPLIGHSFVNTLKWYSFFLFFLNALLFGGVEEIGWRYTFQSTLEKTVPFEVAVIATYVSWGIWHFMYFYIAGVIFTVNVISFLCGLLGTCFALGAIYHISKSLWLCVLYHALINSFSQVLYGVSINKVLPINLIIITLAVILVHVTDRKKNHMEAI